MILHADALAAPRALTATVCIVGAGPVGITLALELAAAGTDVLLLEAGGEAPSAETQDAYRGEVVDATLHGPLDLCRERRLGGSSTIWGGRSTPLDPIDLAPRDWVDDSGWPIPWTTLASYYPRAARWCEIGAPVFVVEEGAPSAMPAMISGFLGGAAWSTDRLERFSCPTDFGCRYRARLVAAPTLRVVLGAATTELLLDPTGTRATGVAARTAGGEPLTVTADTVVVATGGLETARLLLASRTVQSRGIGNAHDNVGRYYMSHLAGTLGRFVPAAGVAIDNRYGVSDEGVYIRRRLALRDEAQRTHRLQNLVARLHHPRIGDPTHRSGVLSALWLGRAAVPRQFRTRLAEGGGGWQLSRHARNVAAQLPTVIGFAGRMAIGRRLAERKMPSVVARPPAGIYTLDVHAEQAPNRASRVRLSEARDRLGMPRLAVDWRYTPGDIASVERALALLAEELAHSGAGTLTIAPGEVARELIRWGAYPGHHIGLARMGTDPRTSVVDADGAVHGIRRLFVAGTATFPTSSQANPTLTAVALAVRLADHLARGR